MYEINRINMNKRILPLIMMALLFPLMTWAQGIMVTGKVISGDDGMGLPGVTVTIKGDTKVCLGS